MVFSCNPVYPRWRGEHASRQRRASPGTGLSPLARGTLSRPSVISVDARFIPAGAGNTIPIVWGGDWQTVYPRWRGEHVVQIVTVQARAGLSPLARGTLRHPSRPASHCRFIPAGAGNTKNSGVSPLTNSVYPRWRGEHDISWGATSGTCGLSPLARGTQDAAPLFCRTTRFIPAGAGNTHQFFLDTCQTTVYPRWRGEHTKKIDFNINSF